MRAAARVVLALIASLGLYVAMEALGPFSIMAGLVGVGLWLFLGLSAPRDRDSLGWSLLIGTLGFGFSFRWLVGSLGDVGHIPMPLAWGLTLLLGSYVGLLWGLGLWLARKLGVTFVYQGLIAVLFLTGIETLRGLGFLAFDWAAPGYWTVRTPLSVLVQWGGMPLVNFTVLLMGLAVALCLKPSTRKVGFWGVSAAFCLWLGLAFLGPGATWAPWAHVDNREPTVGVLDKQIPEGAQVVIAMQPNLPVLMAASDEANAQRLAQVFDAAKSVVLPDHVDKTPLLWVVPEGVTNVVHGLGRWDAMLDVWGQAFLTLSPLSSVALTTFDWSADRVTNATLMFDKAWRVVAKKRYLVPFGEAIPGWAESLVETWLGITMKGFGKGDDKQPVTIWGDIKLGFMICYETLSETIVRETALTGALPDLWIVSSNLAWFKSSIQPQHLAQAALRAMESNRPLLLVANTGPTVLMDASGHVLAKVPASQASLAVWVKPGHDATPLVITLYPWVWGGLSVLLGVVFFLNRRARRAKASWDY